MGEMFQSIASPLQKLPQPQILLLQRIGIRRLPVPSEIGLLFGEPFQGVISFLLIFIQKQQEIGFEVLPKIRFIGILKRAKIFLFGMEFDRVS